MRRLLVFQHVPWEILGILDRLLRDAGFRIRYMNFGRDPLAVPRVERYHGLIVLGGPMNCDQVDRHPHLQTETEAIANAIELGRPVLGICLGAQLIARALGARVRRNPTREIGWHELHPTAAGRADPLFGTLREREMIFQWHGDRFDIPEQAVHLASSPDCANQAFRYGDNVYALQFHLEVDAAMIRRWLTTPANARELASLPGGQAEATARILADTVRCMPRSLQLAEAFFGRYIAQFHRRRRRLPLPSR